MTARKGVAAVPLGELEELGILRDAFTETLKSRTTAATSSAMARPLTGASTANDGTVA